MANTRAAVGYLLRFGWGVSISLGVVLAAPGCHHDTPTSAGPVPASSFPQTARSGFHFDLKHLPAAQRVAFAGVYRLLKAHDCQCLAAQFSRRAEILEQERRMTARHNLRRQGLQDALLETAALEARNQDAGTALELFYRLAEAEAKRDLLDDSLDQLAAAVASGEKLKAQGLKVPAEFDDFKKQQLDLQADSVRLDAGIRQLNRNLAKMLNLTLEPEEERLWPDGNFQPSGVVPPPAEAIKTAMELRPELLLLRRASDETSLADLAAARKLLSASNVLLGQTGNGALGKLKVLLCSNESGVRREQIDQLANEREREVADEVRQAVDDLQTQTQVLALGRSRTLNAETKLTEIEARRAKGSASAIDVAPVRLTWLKARGDLVHDLMAWHIAQVKLKQAQGLLAAECGYSAHDAVSP